jgi:hypothetical protein
LAPLDVFQLLAFLERRMHAQPELVLVGFWPLD